MVAHVALKRDSDLPLSSLRFAAPSQVQGLPFLVDPLSGITVQLTSIFSRFASVIAGSILFNENPGFAGLSF
ncbi:MAG: hypothetical protein BMS9Abin22_019 [Gammaproteobacteria bacterium]|nr:MAG: hypothetical protein BMS9Abin22_019 [Gammaproteobacteria bacterium]